MHAEPARTVHFDAPNVNKSPNAGVQLRFFPYSVEPSPPDDPGEETSQLPDDLIGMYFTG